MRYKNDFLSVGAVELPASQSLSQGQNLTQPRSPPPQQGCEIGVGALRWPLGVGALRWPQLRWSTAEVVDLQSTAEAVDLQHFFAAAIR